MYSIETKDLTYKFSKQETVLSNINLQVPEGSIYGFLGPNGAGKTTTLRLILGLLKKQGGAITIFGKSFDKNRIELLKKLGSLIEAPSVYGHLTAVENLKILQRVYRCDEKRISSVLDIVGLADTGDKKLTKFSLGMKQRLSIAIALLHRPSLLILDEPTNGLDPNGIIEIRKLLLKLNKEFGLTIVISSHLLDEIEKIVTHIGIINKGAILFQGTLEELRWNQAYNSSIKFKTSDPAKTAKIIFSNGFVPIPENGEIVMPSVDKETIADLNKQFVNGGISVYQISRLENNLESIFINLIKNKTI